MGDRWSLMMGIKQYEYLIRLSKFLRQQKTQKPTKKKNEEEIQTKFHIIFYL